MKKNNKKLNIKEIIIEVGLDEVGRGSLFGPLVVASFMIIKIDNKNPYQKIELKDSKKLTYNQRLDLFKKIINIIKNNKDISKIYFCFISNDIIDKINILNANLLGFEKLIIQNLKNILNNKVIVKNINKVKHINFYIDGDKKPKDIENKIQEFLKTYHSFEMLKNKINILNYIKGDSNIKVIQAAAILAKVTRDKYIQYLSKKYPIYDSRYNLYNNKGYYEEAHIKGIKNYGLTIYHRKSFLKKYLQQTLF